MDAIPGNLPALIWLGIFVAVVGFVWSVFKGGLSTERRIERLIREGRYVQAAELAQDRGRDAEAIDYFIRAQEPMRAAQLAAKNQSFKQAAELCERAGEHERAAKYYEQAGLKQRANELRKLHAAPRGQDMTALLSAPPPASPKGSAEERFRAAKAQGAASTIEKARIQSLGREAAEAALSAGDLKGAAQLYKDAELYEEAIHLYVNVLGKADEAATILVDQGKHERAAELLENAGQAERAAAVWAKLSLSADKPETIIPRIQELHEQTALGVLDELTMARPLAKTTAELHYQHGLALEKKGDLERAARVFAAIEQEVAGYKDTSERLATLDSQLEATGKAGRRSSAPPRRGSLPAEDDDELDEDAIAEALSGRRSIVPGRRGRPSIVVQPVMVRGFEAAPVQVDLLLDSAVHAARTGPSIGALKKHLEGTSCTPENIGSYYQLGLAYLAAGQYAEASIELGKVVAIAPTYRDAAKRLEEINAWRKALAPNAHVGLPASLTGLRIVLGMPDANAGAQAPTGAPMPAGATTGDLPKAVEARPSGAPIAASPVDTRYSIAGELGRGGMAVVYRATDTLLGRDIALKYLSEQFSANEKMQEMFQREARAVAQLNHPNIVTIHDFGVMGGRTFLAMEYVEGLTVRQLLDEKKTLPVKLTLKITLQLLSALEAAHARRIVHRDIKLSNMMRTPDGRVKLMDFGLARSFDGENKASMVAGTPGYMAPEQLAGEDIDHRADLFAVGVSLYEMLAGRQPFKGIVRSNPPKPLATLAPNIPVMLERVVHKSISLDPRRRFQSAEAMAAPLATILEACERYGSEGPPVGRAA